MGEVTAVTDPNKIDPNKIVVFTLKNKKDELSQKVSTSEEEYAIRVNQFKEIISYQEPTRMPGRPNYVTGILNIRGETIPVMDLGYRLNYDTDYNTSKIIIVYIHEEKVGLIVQNVKDVTDFIPNEMEEAPYRDGIDFVDGVIKKNEYNSDDKDDSTRRVIKTRIITLLDANKIIRKEDTKYDLID